MTAENAWRIAMEEAAEWSQQCQTESASEYFRGWHSARREMAAALPTLPMPPAFRAAVEAEARAFAQREHPYADLHVEALAEIKATIDGKSDQPVAAIIEGVLEEIKARSALLSRLEAKGESHD